MVNVIKAVTHPPQSIIEYTTLSLFRYNDYLSNYRSNLLSYMVVINVWLGKHYNFLVEDGRD